MQVPTADEVFHLDPGSGVASRGTPFLLWSAPGSTNLAQLASAITRPKLDGFRSVSGPWAIAGRDPRSSEVLLIADPLGLMPLFWARTTSGSIVAAAWLAALVDRGDVDDRLDFEGLLLDRGWELHDRRVLHRTHFAAVSRVPGGCALRIRPCGSTILDRYWDACDLSGPDTSLDLGDCADILRERIDRAIRSLAPADTPVGAHVSGGVDSSAIACRANQILDEGASALVAGYSWAPPRGAGLPRLGDERDLLDDISTAEGFPIRTVDPLADDDAWYRELDPTRYPDSTHFRERFVLPVARDDGVEVMLSGWGGDEAASYNGFGVMRTLLRQGRLRTMLREAQARTDVRARGPVSGPARARQLPARLLSPMPAPLRLIRAPGRELLANRQWRAGNRKIEEFSTLAAEVQRSARREVDKVTDWHARQVSFLQRGHLQQRVGWWYQTGRLFGIQYRYPLLDLGVVEAALRMPWWAFMNGGWDRPAFRLAVEPWVPESVAWNVTKDEPALLGGLRQMEPMALRRPPVVEPMYDEVMELAEVSWTMDSLPTSATAPPAHQPIWARPDLAPRPR